MTCNQTPLAQRPCAVFALVLGVALTVVPACMFDESGLRTPGADGSVPQPDANVSDARPPDGALPDANLADGAQPDATLPDATLPDGALPDATLPDATLPDGTTPTDTDGDGVPDVSDNCPHTPNTDQANSDGDTLGDACDNCPITDNENQLNSDGDTHGDACDNCPHTDNENQDNHDADEFGDACDNCPNVTNPNQDNLDGDNLGDACDPDRDGDTVRNAQDPDPDVPQSVDYYSDLNSDDGDFTFVTSGNWTYSGSSICQSNDSIRHQRARLNDPQMSITDMVVETEMTVASVDLSTTEWPAAGVSFRFVDAANGNFDAYHCTVDLENGRLAIIESWNFNNYYVHSTSANGSVSLTGTYRLRAIAEGDALSCTLLPSGPTITATDTVDPLRTGTAGFFTYLASACFDYLLVYSPPPP